jgi:hypothetical protein
MVLTKGWTSRAPKIPNKIWVEELEIRNNVTYRNFSRFKLKFELNFKEVSMT